MNIKQQIKQLEEIANKETVIKWDYSDGARDTAKQALAIIKKQEEVIGIALGALEYFSDDSGYARISLNKINKLLEEND
jgi:hypothetical protein